MYEIFKNSYFRELINMFVNNIVIKQNIKCNRSTSEDYFQILNLLDKMDISLILLLTYDESSQLWMSLGLRPDINTKSAKKVLTYTNFLPDELIRHIASYVPEVNYTFAKKCNNCDRYHREIKKYVYIRSNLWQYIAQGFDSQMVCCAFPVKNNIDAIRQICESDFDGEAMNTFNRDYFRARAIGGDIRGVIRRRLLYPEPPNNESVNVSRIREFTGGDAPLPPRRLFNNLEDFVPRNYFI